MYHTVLFDLDGTLTEPKEGITKSVQYALKFYGIEESDLEQLTCFIGPPLIESFVVYYGFSMEQAREAVEKYRERFSTVGLFENSVFDGIKELLEQLSAQGKTLAVATSKPTVYAERILEQYGLHNYFTAVIGSELDGTRTDKAEVIEEALRRLSVTQEERASVLMIGDREHDIIGASKCQIRSIGVEFGYAREGELQKAGADYVADTVTQLNELLQKGNL